MQPGPSWTSGGPPVFGSLLADSPTYRLGEKQDVGFCGVRHGAGVGSMQWPVSVTLMGNDEAGEEERGSGGWWRG